MPVCRWLTPFYDDPHEWAFLFTIENNRCQIGRAATPNEADYNTSSWIPPTALTDHIMITLWLELTIHFRLSDSLVCTRRSDAFLWAYGTDSEVMIAIRLKQARTYRSGPWTPKGPSPVPWRSPVSYQPNGRSGIIMWRPKLRLVV